MSRCTHVVVDTGYECRLCADDVRRRLLAFAKAVAKVAQHIGCLRLHLTGGRDCMECAGCRLDELVAACDDLAHAEVKP